MKTTLIACLLGILVASANAADPAGVVLEKEVAALARVLQARLPALALDGMCEVERQGNGWDFSFRVKELKDSADEVQVIVRSISATQSELRVRGVKVFTSLITSRRSADPALSKEWTERVVKLVEERG